MSITVTDNDIAEQPEFWDISRWIFPVFLLFKTSKYVVRQTDLGVNTFVRSEI